MNEELSLAQKLEMVRTAIPRGLSAGDSGLAEFNSKPQQQSSPWPQFTSSTSESKLYTENPDFSQEQDIPVSTVGESCIGLSLYIRTVDDNAQVWISAGTVNGELPSGFDAANGKNIANSGAGNVWVEININQDTGEIVSVAVDGGSTTTPSNTDTSFYYTLGYYEYDGESPSVTNYGCGSINVTICRNWFASQSPYYNLTFSR